MLTLQTLPKKKIFDMTQEEDPVEIEIAIEQMKSATIH